MDFINPEQRKDLQLAELFPSLIYLYAFTFNEYRHPTYIKLVKQVLTVGRTTSHRITFILFPLVRNTVMIQFLFWKGALKIFIKKYIANALSVTLK